MDKKLKQEFEKEGIKREKTILLSRETIKISKLIISAIHNNNLKEADKQTKVILDKIKEIKKIKYEDANYSMAFQEYVEAILLLEYAKTSKILPFSKFSCSSSDYILGLIDFVGELQRRAVLEISRNNENELPKIYKDVTKIYNHLLTYSFRGNIRKKFDSVKYIMIKMEDLLLQLKLKK